MSLTAIAAAVALSPLDDLIILGLLSCLAKSRPSTTSSVDVVEGMVSRQLLEVSEMAAKTTNPVAAPVETISREDRVAAIMAQLRSPKNTKSFMERITDVAVDAVANSGDIAARFAAAGTTAVENATDSFELERERQLKRRAERLLAQAEALAA